MKPYFDAGSIALYNGDAREVLELLPAGFAHCLVTDPPYGMAYQDGQNVSVRADSARQGIRLFRQVLPALDRCLAPSNQYVFCHRWSMPDFMDELAPYWQLKNLLVWDKGTPGRGDCLGNYWFEYELVLFCLKGGRKYLNGSRDRSIQRVKPPRNRVHPTQKPVDLLRLYIEKSTQPGECVVDPFAGSGSTLVAAAIAGRCAFGTEIDERYCEVAARRIEAALRGEVT